MMNHSYRILSLTLIIAMLFGLVPAYAWESVGNNFELQGEEAEGSADSPFSMQQNVDEQFEDGTIVVEGELSDDREVSSKRFHLSSGLSLAMQYPHEVHFLQEEELVDIDNTLKEADNGLLRNQCSPVEMDFPAELASNKPIAIRKDGYELRFYQENIQPAAAEVKNPAEYRTVEELQAELKLTEQEARAEYNHRAVETRSESSIVFSEVYPGCDLRYDLEGLNLKECIVIRSPEAVLPEYTVLIESEGLTAETTDEGEIHFQNEEGIIFRIPAPVVYDSKGSYGVVFSDLEQISDSSCRLMYSIDAKWLAEDDRCYPIVLDPTIQANSTEANTSAVNIQSRIPDGNDYNSSWGMDLKQGYSSSAGIYRSYLKIHSLPALGMSDHIVSAKLKVTGSGYYRIQAYMVDETSLVDYSQITWNHQPSFDPEMLDYVSSITDDTEEVYDESFDVTKAAKYWYGGGINNGLYFTSVREDSYYCSLTSPRKAKLKVYYTSTNGLEDHWDYTSVPVGRAGTAHIQYLTGNLTVTRTDLTYGGSILPAEASFVYNLAQRNLNFGYGKGFRSIYNQTIKKKTASYGVNSDLWYVWTDGDGTDRYFQFWDDGENSGYTNELKDGYSFSKGSLSGANPFSIKDKKGNYLRFDRYGRLFKIQEKIGYSSYNEIQIQYTEDAEDQFRIQRVIDGAGRIYEYSYTDPLTGNLASVSFLDRNGDRLETVQYTYDPSGRLTYVTYADNGNIQYIWYYTRLTGICGIENTAGQRDRLNIGYPNVSSNSGNQRVSSLSYLAGGTEVSRLNFTYGPMSCTLDDGILTGDGEDRKTTYHFNSYGNTISVSNSGGQWASGTYEKDLDPEAAANRLSSASRLQETLTGLNHLQIQADGENIDLTASENLIVNGDFSEALSNGWVKKSLTDTGDLVNRSGSRGKCDTHAFQLDGGGNTLSRGLRQTIVLSGTRESTVTFGGWFQYHGPVLRNGRIAGLQVELYSGSTKKATAYAMVDTGNKDWQFISGEVHATRFSKIVVTIIDNCFGSILYADGIQLTEDSCNYRYTYNADGDIKTIKTPAGKTTTYSYSNGNLTAINPPGNGEFHFTYSYNHLTKETTPTGLQTDYTYDSHKNRLTESIKPTSTAPALKSETVYSADGNMVENITAADRNTVVYDNDYDHLRVDAVTDPKGIRTEYTYDAVGRPVETARLGVSIENTYDADRLTALSRTASSGAMTYGFTYGLGGLPLSVTAADRTLVENEYNEDTLTLQTSTYGNGDRVDFAYNELTDELTEKTVRTHSGEQKKYQYFYNAQGRLCRVLQNRLESNRSWGPETAENYLYNAEGQPERILQTRISSLGNTETILYDSSLQYSANGKVTSLTETVGSANAVTNAYAYTYDLDDRPVTASYGTITETLAYDSYSRLSGKTVNSGSAQRISQQYTYRNVGTAYTTPQVSSLATTFGSNTLNHSYTYDANGNILSDSTAAGTVLYEYDGFDQLVCEKNGILGKAWEYTYDLGGNILSKRERAYQNGAVGAVLSTHSYTYGDEDWIDLLTGYDNQSITYDEIGNPLTYQGWNMTWKAGRQLAGMSNGSAALSFDYNESGLRTSKVVNGAETQYIWSGDRLVAELGPSRSFYFHYDAAGEMTGYTYKTGSTTTECLFVKNLQGDVERVISDTGMLLATYTYDAWGSICQSSGSLANINPIRYRSYYYDPETGLYYLQSRYYDPQVGRFVNADGQVDSLVLNLFFYCGNNPVYCIDSDGCKYEMVGVGVQIDGSGSWGTCSGNFGMEIVIYWGTENAEKEKSIEVAIYTYSGCSVSMDSSFINTIVNQLCSAVDDLKRDPSGTMNQILNSNKSKLSGAISLSGFAVFGNEMFREVRNYTREFDSLSMNLGSLNINTAWSNSCITVGLGRSVWGCSTPSINRGHSWYWLLNSWVW